MNTRPASAPAVQSPAVQTSRNAEEELLRGIPVGDIHDIRMLTATGPIELPTPVRAQQERRKAG